MRQKRSKYTNLPFAKSPDKPQVGPTKNVKKVTIKEVNLPPVYEDEEFEKRNEE